MTNGTGETPKKPRKRDYARWLAAGLLAIATLVAWSASYAFNSLPICREEAGDTAAIKVCGPFGLADALWLGVIVLVIFLLLWPDVSEVSITGIGSLKRRVEEQEKKTAELERFVVSQMLSLSIANSQTQNVNVVVTSEALRQARDEVPPPPPEGLRAEQSGVTPIDPQRAVKLTQILDLYERMTDIFSTVTGQRRGRPIDPEGRILIDHPALLGWYREYKEPFNTFRTARSAAAHNPASLSDDDLQTAIELGERLLFTMREAVRGVMPTGDDPAVP